MELANPHLQYYTVTLPQPKRAHNHVPKNSDRLRNYSILTVIASTRRVRGNLSTTMRDCFTAFAMTTFYRCSGVLRLHI